MPWLEISLKADKQQVEAYSQLLMDLEAQAITLQDAEEQDLLEPLPGETPLWQKTWVTGLFSHELNAKEVLAQIQVQLANMPPYQVRQLQDQAWERVWLEYFRPICFAQRFWICPSQWTPPEPDTPTLILDPGLAFGTGSHATTYLCLQWLAQQNQLASPLLDFGCGSGILALSALKMGVQQAYCVDIDEQALVATRDNAQRNGLQDQIVCSKPEGLGTQKYPLVVANILLEPLCQLADWLCSLLQPHGELVLSGVLANQFPKLKQAYSPFVKLRILDSRQDWILVYGEKTK